MVSFKTMRSSIFSCKTETKKSQILFDMYHFIKIILCIKKKYIKIHHIEVKPMIIYSDNIDIITEPTLKTLKFLRQVSKTFCDNNNEVYIMPPNVVELLDTVNLLPNSTKITFEY